MVHVSELAGEQERKTAAGYTEQPPGSCAPNALNMRLDGPDGSRIVRTVSDPVDAVGGTASRVKGVRSLLPHIRQVVRTPLTLSFAGILGTSLSNRLADKGTGFI